MGTSVATELMARDLDGALRWRSCGALLFNGSMIQGAASPTIAQRLLRGRLGPVLARLSSERFFRQQFGSVFSAEHPLSDEEAADQWSLIAHEGGQRLGHRLISYMDEREAKAERWHGALREWPKPLHLAWGMEDPVATLRVLDGVRALRPAAPLTQLDGLGHYPQIEDPGRLAGALESLVAGLIDRSARVAIMPRFARVVVAAENGGAGSFSLIAGISCPQPKKQEEVGVRETLITEEGLEKLKEELNYLQTDKRREVADRIKEAREFGDITENAEYDDAKNEQAMLEQRISQLQDRLRRSTVIDDKARRHRAGHRRRGRPRQGPEVRQVPEVQAGRRGGGRPRGAEALERVADRQGADRGEEERGRLGRGAARPQAQAQGHQDRSRLAGV